MWLRLFEGLTQLSAGGDVSSSSVVLQVVCWAAGDGDVRCRRPRRRSDAGPPPPQQQLLSVITAVVSRLFRNHICTSVGRRRRRVALVVQPYYVVFCTASKYRFSLLYFEETWTDGHRPSFRHFAISHAAAEIKRLHTSLYMVKMQ